MNVQGGNGEPQSPYLIFLDLESSAFLAVPISRSPLPQTSALPPASGLPQGLPGSAAPSLSGFPLTCLNSTTAF